MVLRRPGSTSSQARSWRYQAAFSSSSVPYFCCSQARNLATVFGQKQNSGFGM